MTGRRNLSRGTTREAQAVFESQVRPHKQQKQITAQKRSGYDQCSEIQFKKQSTKHVFQELKSLPGSGASLSVSFKCV